MSKFNRAAIISAFVAGFGLFGMAQNANASLIIAANGNTVASSNTNSFANYNGTIGSFNINNLTLVGIDAYGGSGKIFDAGSLNVSTAGTGTLTLTFTETNISAGAASTFASLFTGQFSEANVTRAMYLDTGNTGATTTLLGAITGATGSFASTLPLNGLFSLTEVITINATARGAFLSSDDSVTVPEPMSLGLLGAGLAGIGFIRRRAKTA